MEGGVAGRVFDGLIGAWVGGAIVLIALWPRLLRLEQWAWGANRTNGIDGELKELRREFFSFARRTVRHDTMQDLRNLRQHPDDHERDKDYDD